VSHRASGTKARLEALAGGLDFVGGYDPGAEHTRFLGAALLLQLQSVLGRVSGFHSRRQLLARAAIAASRVSA
jgi:hypothetical protein